MALVGAGAPGARRSTSSGLAIAKLRHQRAGDVCPAEQQLVAVAAEQVVHQGRFVVIEKSHLVVVARTLLCAASADAHN